jgi:hypothetical protein
MKPTQNSGLRAQRAKRSIFIIFLSSDLCFLSWPAQAGKTCTEEALYMVDKAAACLDHQDPGCAKIKLDNVLQREPGCAEALFIKGWTLQYDEGNPQAAQALQQKALQLNPDLASFWEKRGHFIESQQTTQEFSHFDIQFYGAGDRGKAWDAVSYLNGMYDELGSIFGAFPPNHIPVIVFTTEEFLDAWRAPFIAGFFDKRDGKIRIRVDEMPGGDEEFRHRARHEFTHAFMYQVYPHDLPSWVSEGVAEFYAHSNPAGGFWKDERLEQIRKMIKGSDWLTLDQIQEAIAKKRVSPYIIQQAYQESEAMVIFVAKERGDSWIPNVMNYLRKNGETFEAAFKTVLQTTPADEIERLHHIWE